MASERLCQTFLRAAAATVRRCRLARGRRKNAIGQVCMLGAMDYCGVSVEWEEQQCIQDHVAKLLPMPGPHDKDCYNGNLGTAQITRTAAHHIAWWSNTQAKDAEEVARKLEEAAETC